MKVKQLVEFLKKCDQEKEIIVSSDEELNTLYTKFQVCFLEDIGKYCIFGLSGTELEE
jgi:hypothetical protein